MARSGVSICCDLWKNANVQIRFPRLAAGLRLWLDADKLLLIYYMNRLRFRSVRGIDMVCSEIEHNALSAIQRALYGIREKCNPNSDLTTNDKSWINDVADSARLLANALLTQKANTHPQVFADSIERLTESMK